MSTRTLLALALVVGASAASAQDAQTYLYDPQGRLVAVTTARAGGGQVSGYVLDDADNRTSHRTTNFSSPPTANTLSSPYALVPTQKLTSPNGQYTMTLEPSGDLVIRNISGGLVWNSCTAQGRSAMARVDSNGRLRIYDTQFGTIWTATTAVNPGAVLTLANTGVATLATSGGAVIWTSGIPCA